MTYSIVLREPPNHFGIAVATKHFAVGALVPHLISGVGAIATQASTNPHLALRGLTFLQERKSIETSLNLALAEDPEKSTRQIHGVDFRGRSWAWTGSATQAWSGHVNGENFSIAGNILTGKKVLDSCQASLEKTKNLFESGDPYSLEKRLLDALEEGEVAGGDSRGRQSAALITIRGQPFPYCHLRVDHHRDPLGELKKLFFEFQQAYYQEFINSIPQS